MNWAVTHILNINGCEDYYHTCLFIPSVILSCRLILVLWYQYLLMERSSLKHSSEFIYIILTFFFNSAFVMLSCWETFQIIWVWSPPSCIYVLFFLKKILPSQKYLDRILCTANPELYVFAFLPKSRQSFIHHACIEKPNVVSITVNKWTPGTLQCECQLSDCRFKGSLIQHGQRAKHLWRI